MLFNIYMDNVFKTLVSGFSDISNIYKKACADDVVFILKQKYLNSFIGVAKKEFQEFGLIFNENNSQVHSEKEKSLKIFFLNLQNLKVWK